MIRYNLTFEQFMIKQLCTLLQPAFVLLEGFGIHYSHLLSMLSAGHCLPTQLIDIVKKKGTFFLFG